MTTPSWPNLAFPLPAMRRTCATILTAFALGGLLILRTSPVNAQQAANPSPSASPTPTVINKSEGDALRMSVVNAVVNYANNARQATIKFEWEFLPESSPLRAMTADVKPITFTLSNADLDFIIDKSGNRDFTANLIKWSGGVKMRNGGKDYAALVDALGVTEVADLRGSPGSNTYLKKLKSGLAAGDLVANEETTAEIDHLALRFLFGIRGVVFGREVPDANIQGPRIVEFDRDVTWEIRLYPVELQKSTTIKTFYRASIVARVKKPQTITFPGTTAEKATLRSFLRIKRPANYDRTTSLELAQVTTEVDLTQPQTKPLTGVDAAVRGGTVIEGILQFAGNTTLDDVVAFGLFKGTRNASLFYGGLLGQGEVKQLVGVNQWFGNSSPETQTGLLIGIAPENDNSLFVGPSFQYNALSISGGLIAQRRTSGEKKLTVSGGVAVNLDLSQLIGGKKNVKTISLQNSTIGGVGSDTIAANAFPLNVTISVDPGLSAEERNKLQGKILTLTRTQKPGVGDEFVDIPAEQREIFTYPIRENGSPVIKEQRVPPGRYEVKINAPETFAVFGANGANMPITSFIVGENVRLKQVSYIVKKKP